jgi:hypothetical protein
MSLNTNDIQFNYVCRFDETLKFITKNGCDKKRETVKKSDVINEKCFGCPGPLDIENEEEKKIEINYNVVEKSYLPGIKIEKNYINKSENKEDSPFELISVHDRYMEKEEIEETYNKLIENKKGCEKEMVENNKLNEKKEKKNNYKIKCKNENCATMISTYGRKTGFCLPCYNKTKKVEAKKKIEAVKVVDEVLKDGEKESIKNDFEKDKVYLSEMENRLKAEIELLDSDIKTAQKKIDLLTKEIQFKTTRKKLLNYSLENCQNMKTKLNLINDKSFDFCKECDLMGSCKPDYDCRDFKQ